MEKHQTSHRQVNLRQHLKSGWRSTTKRKKRLNVKMHQGNLLHSQVTPYHQVFLLYGNCLLHCYHHLLEGTLNSQEKSGVNCCLTYGFFYAWVPAVIFWSPPSSFKRSMIFKGWVHLHRGLLASITIVIIHQWRTQQRLVCHFFVLSTFWCHLWSITEQTNGNFESIC